MTISPIVHLNGTSRQALIDALVAAIDSLEDAGRMLAQTAPNARDYYVGEPGLFDRAASAHDARMQALRRILAELSDQLVAIEDQS